jgi:hypothetical protein
VKDRQKALDGSQVLLFSEAREADERATRRLPRGECSATAGVGYRLNPRLELNAQLYWRTATLHISLPALLFCPAGRLMSLLRWSS